MNDQSLHVLVVDNDASGLLLLKAALDEVRTSEFALTGATRLEEALLCLHDKPFDAVLLHLDLPDCQGLETFVRMQREHPALPILILSDRSDEALAIQAVQSGAQDFVPRDDISGVLLARSIRYAIDRKSSEQRLVASEVSYRRLFETAHDGIFILDAATGQITNANPYLEEMLGYTRAEFIGKQLWEIAPFRDQAAFRTLQEKGYIRYDDLPLMARDGRCVSVEFVSNVYVVGSQHVIQCNIRDITERKQAAAAEVDSKQFFQSTLDALPAHIAVLDGNGQIVAVNQAWRQFLDENEGIALSCEIGANYIEVCEKSSGHLADEGVEVSQGIQGVLKGEHEAFCLEYACHGPTEERWFNVCVTPFDGEGPVRAVVAHENITERKQAEKLIRTSEANLAKSQQMARLGSWELDLTNLDDINANPLRWSDEIFRILGYAPGEFEPSNEAFFRAVHPDDRATLGRMMAEAVQDGKPYSVEHRIILPDGQERIVQAQSEILYNEETGQPLKMIGLGQDITQRKLTEATLLESEARFRTAIAEAPVPIMIHREDGKVLQISKGWTKYSGYELADVATIRDWTERAYGEASAKAHEYIKSLYQVEETRSEGEWTITAKDGQKRVWDFKTTPLGTFGDNQRVVINTAFDITERQQSKEALEARNREIVTIWESMTDAFFSLDTQWRFTYVNPQTAHLWQRNAEELIGECIWEVFPPAVDSKFYTEYHRAVEEQAVLSFEAFYAPGNAWRDVHVYPSPAGLSVYFRDITERKQAEALLMESRQRLALATESAHIGIWDWDIVTNKMVWDAQMIALYGIRAQDFSGAVDAWQNGLHPEDRDQAEADLSAALDGSRDFHPQFRVIWPNGEVRSIEAHAIVKRADDGSAQRMTGVNWDITERKLDEAALQRSEERYRSLAQATAQIVWTASADGMIEDMPAWRDFTGQTVEEVEGRGWTQALHPSDHERIENTIAQCREIGIYEDEYRVRAANGEYRLFAVRGVPIMEDDGSVREWVGTFTDIHDRRQAEEERDRFFTLSLDMLAIISEDGYMKRLNPAWETKLGFSNAELMAVPFLEFVHPDDRAATQEEDAKLGSGNQVMQFENRYRCRDGSYKWLLWMCAPFEDLFYCVAHDVTAMRDAEAALQQANDELEARVEERTTKLQLEILERERAEQEVRAQARQHEAVAELGRRALLNFDLDTLLEGVVSLVTTTLDVTVCSFWERLPGSDSLRMRAVTGWSQEMQSPPDKTIGDDTQIGYTALLKEPVIADDLAQETRFRPDLYLLEMGNNSLITIPVHDGAFYGVIAASSPHKQSFTQNEVYFLQTVANVLASALARKQSEAENLQLNTNLHVANQELRANETHLLQGNQISTDLMRLRVRTHNELQAALQQITEAASMMLDIERSSVWLFNEDGTALRCHDLYERAAQRHSNGFELFEDEHYFPALKAHREVIADDARTNPATRDFLETYLEPNGIASILDVALVVGGKHIGVLCGEHIGTPRQWQAEDRTFASAIASVCSLVLESYERTRAENALHEAKEEAERATEEANTANLAKSEFLSRMSHELRTPLNAILGFGQILEQQEISPLAKESVGYILQGGRHLLDLINEVLDIARVEAGRLELSLEPIALDDIVPEACALMRTLAAERHIRLDAHLAERGHSYVLADRQRLIQVLINLLANAIKYNRAGGQVEVSCRQKPGGWTSIAVRDTGPGISPQDLTKLFMPFERLSAAGSEVEGTGLGLALSQRLVTAMGGTLNVESTLGLGSTFTIDLPQADSPEEQVVNMPRQPFSVSPEQGTERTYSVLCIEDNPSNLRLMETIFAMRPQIKLLTAIQGSIGLDMARQHAPDLILLDLNLPDIHGSEVLARLQKSGITRDIPVVVVSADATPNQIERLLTAGARNYLTKPLDVRQFFRIVDKFLQAPAAIP